MNLFFFLFVVYAFFAYAVSFQFSDQKVLLPVKLDAYTTNKNKSDYVAINSPKTNKNPNLL